MEDIDMSESAASLFHQDIWNLIRDQVDIPTARNLALTCRAFQPLGEAAIYRDIDLTKLPEDVSQKPVPNGSTNLDELISITASIGALALTKRSKLNITNAMWKLLYSLRVRPERINHVRRFSVVLSNRNSRQWLELLRLIHFQVREVVIHPSQYPSISLDDANQSLGWSISQQIEDIQLLPNLQALSAPIDPVFLPLVNTLLKKSPYLNHLTILPAMFAFPSPHNPDHEELVINPNLVSLSIERVLEHNPEIICKILEQAENLQKAKIGSRGSTGGSMKSAESIWTTLGGISSLKSLEVDAIFRPSWEEGFENLTQLTINAFVRKFSGQRLEDIDIPPLPNLKLLTIATSQPAGPGFSLSASAAHQFLKKDNQSNLLVPAVGLPNSVIAHLDMVPSLETILLPSKVMVYPAYSYEWDFVELDSVVMEDRMDIRAFQNGFQKLIWVQCKTHKMIDVIGEETACPQQVLQYRTWYRDHFLSSEQLCFLSDLMDYGLDWTVLDKLPEMAWKQLEVWYLEGHLQKWDVF